MIYPCTRRMRTAASGTEITQTSAIKRCGGNVLEAIMLARPTGPRQTVSDLTMKHVLADCPVVTTLHSYHAVSDNVRKGHVKTCPNRRSPDRRHILRENDANLG